MTEHAPAAKERKPQVDLCWQKKIEEDATAVRWGVSGSTRIGPTKMGAETAEVLGSGRRGLTSSPLCGMTAASGGGPCERKSAKRRAAAGQRMSPPAVAASDLGATSSGTAANGDGAWQEERRQCREGD